MDGQYLGAVRRRDRWRWLALGLALLPFAAAAQSLPQRLPGLGAHDPRTVVDIAHPPWNAVLRLQIPGVSLCTAVLMAPQVALTAAHCLYSARLGHFAPAGAVHVLTGYDSGSFAGHALVQSYRVLPGYDPRAPDATRGADAAVLDLATPLGDVALPLADAHAGQTVALAGYSQDRGQRLQIDPDCEVLGIGTALLRHSCAGTKGGSGGPLLLHAADGSWTVVGLQSGANPRDAGGVAVTAARLRGLIGP